MSKETSDKWVTVFTTIISRTAGSQKCLTLKHPEENKEFVLADLRGYYNGKSSKSGICMTPYEFDWFAKSLLYAKDTEKSLSNKTAARVLTIKPKKRIRGVEVFQLVNDQQKRINLYKDEISTILEKYGTFYNIIEEMEEEAYTNSQVESGDSDNDQELTPE